MCTWFSTDFMRTLHRVPGSARAIGVTRAHEIQMKSKVKLPPQKEVLTVSENNKKLIDLVRACSSLSYPLAIQGRGTIIIHSFTSKCSTPLYFVLNPGWYPSSLSHCEQLHLISSWAFLFDTDQPGTCLTPHFSTQPLSILFVWSNHLRIFWQRFSAS